MLTSNNGAKRQSLVFSNSIASAGIDLLSIYPARDDEPIISCLSSSNHKTPYIVTFSEVRFITLAVKTCGSRRIHVAHCLIKFSLPLFFFFFIFFYKKLGTIFQK